MSTETQTETESPEVDMADADVEEHRKDEATGKVMTYPEVLADNHGDNVLADAAWHLMTPVSSGTDTPGLSAGVAGMALTQAQKEKQQLEQVWAKKAKEKAAADKAAAEQQATAAAEQQKAAAADATKKAAEPQVLTFGGRLLPRTRPRLTSGRTSPHSRTRTRSS